MLDPSQNGPDPRGVHAGEWLLGGKRVPRPQPLGGVPEDVLSKEFITPKSLGDEYREPVF